MLNDDHITTAADHITRRYRNKNRFISDLRARFKVELPTNPTYKTAITSVITSGWEKEFSRAFLNAESIADWIELSSRLEILDWFSKSEILKIVKGLREVDSGWSPGKGVKNDLIFSILKRFDNDELGEAIARYLQKEDMDDFFFSTKEYVVGPYGVVEIEKGKDWETEFLIIRVISEILDETGIHEFMSVISGGSQGLRISKSDPLIMAKAYQIILAKYSDEEVFHAISEMVAKGKITINEIMEIDTHRHLTPYGIIESKGDPLDNLVEVVIKHTREDTLRTHLVKYEIPKEDLRQGVIELCLRETPRFFGELFGLDRMKDIAEELNMVALDRVTVDSMSELWDVILRRLGFDVPSELGVDFSEHIAKIKTEVSNLDVLDSQERESRLIGLMMQFYSKCERIIRDLFYFHAAIIWTQEQEYDDDELEFEIDLEIVNDNAVDQLELDENLEIKLSKNRLTFGEWIGLLRRFAKYLQGRSTDSKRGKANLVKYCGRTELLSGCPFKVLDRLAATRNQYRHDRKGSIPTLSDSVQIISDTEQLYSCFAVKGVKPLVMRVLREIRNEFGLEYYIIIDESDRRRRIQKTVKLPTKSLFMIPAYGGFAPESFIAVKPFW